MKVLHVETGKHLYGGARQVLYLLEGLKTQGVECELVACSDAAIAQAARAQGFQVHEVPMAGDLDIRFPWQLRRIVRSSGADLVHLHSRRGADLWGGIGGRFARVPVVLSRRVDNPEPRWWVALKYRLYDRVVTISQGIADVLLAEGLAPERLAVVPSAVDLGRFSCNRGRLPQDLPVQVEDGVVVAMVAQFISRKGHDVALQAMRQLPPSCGHVRLLLFGQGPLRASIEAEIESLGLAGQVHCVGFYPQIEQVLPAVDFLVHPAEMEGLGVALLEAAASCVPAVATGVGGIPEVVVDGVTGLLIPPGDPPALAAAMDRLVHDTELRRRLGVQAREWVEARFSIPAMVAGNLEVYRALLNR